MSASGNGQAHFRRRHHSTQLDEMLAVAQDQRANNQEHRKEGAGVVEGAVQV